MLYIEFGFFIVETLIGLFVVGVPFLALLYWLSKGTWWLLREIGEIFVKQPSSWTG